MTCLFRFQGITTTDTIAVPGSTGFGDIGSATNASVNGPLVANPRLDFASTSLSTGRPMRVLKAYDSIVGGDTFYWSILPSNKPYPAPSAYTGPWSMRMYVRLPTPSGTLTFMNVMQGATVNVAFVRLISTNRITRWGGNTVTLANANGMYRIELQADPNRTAKLVWRIYYEDELVPIGGTQDSAVTNVTWDQIRIGSLNSGLFLAQFEWGDIEIHDDYDLGGKFKSNPQDGTTPASATATGAPAWAEGIDGKYNYSTVTNATVAKGSPSYTTYSNVAYATSPATYDRYFDLYVPNDDPPDGGWPVVCWAHHGFFSENSKAYLPTNWRDDLLLRGYAVASIQYIKVSKDLVAPYDSYGTSNLGGRYPSFIIDYKLAAAYIRDNAATWGLNPNKMIASGYSSGGYIGLAAAMSRGLSTDSAGTPLTIAGATAASSPWGGGYTGSDPEFIAAMVFAAPVDMDLANAWDPTYPNSGAVIKRITYRWFQGLVASGSDASSYPQQSIASHIDLNSSSNLCPVAYIRGSADHLIHWEHAEALEDALNTAGIEYHEIVTPNNHERANDIYDIEEQLLWLDTFAYPDTSASYDQWTSFYDGASTVPIVLYSSAGSQLEFPGVDFN